MLSFSMGSPAPAFPNRFLNGTAFLSDGLFARDLPADLRTQSGDSAFAEYVPVHNSRFPECEAIVSAFHKGILRLAFGMKRTVRRRLFAACVSVVLRRSFLNGMR